MNGARSEKPDPTGAASLHPRQPREAGRAGPEVRRCRRATGGAEAQGGVLGGRVASGPPAALGGGSPELPKPGRSRRRPAIVADTEANGQGAVGHCQVGAPVMCGNGQHQMMMPMAAGQINQHVGPSQGQGAVAALVQSLRTKRQTMRYTQHADQGGGRGNLGKGMVKRVERAFAVR